MGEGRGNGRAVPAAIAASLLLVALLVAMPRAGHLVHALFPTLRNPLYTRASFATLALAHLEIVAGATVLAAIVGLGTAIAVTRDAGRDFAPLARTLATAGQTFPPVAVLALAVPFLGYGAAPTMAALVVYAALPILEAGLSGLAGVPTDVRDTADGLGFPPARRLMQVDLPLALPLILAGLRNATIINIGTATIGASVGALSLGSPILEGLAASNPAYVLEGAILVAVLAVAVDKAFDAADAKLVFDFTRRSRN